MGTRRFLGIGLDWICDVMPVFESLDGFPFSFIIMHRIVWYLDVIHFQIITC